MNKFFWSWYLDAKRWIDVHVILLWYYEICFMHTLHKETICKIIYLSFSDELVHNHYTRVLPCFWFLLVKLKVYSQVTRIQVTSKSVLLFFRLRFCLKNPEFYLYKAFSSLNVSFPVFSYQSGWISISCIEYKLVDTNYRLHVCFGRWYEYDGLINISAVDTNINTAVLYIFVL